MSRSGPAAGDHISRRRPPAWTRTRALVVTAGLVIGVMSFSIPSANPSPSSHKVRSPGSSPPPPGVIVTVAGGIGQGLGTSLGQGPNSVAAAPGGQIYLGDINFNVVRRLDPTSDLEQPAVGDGTPGPLGDGGPGGAAQLDGPLAEAVDAAGNVVVADTGNNRVRVDAAETGSFYGIAMTKGNIYTVAGDGTGNFFGDGGPATSAELHGPSGVALDADGNLIIADQRNGRVRVVAANTGTFYGISMTTGDIYTVAGGGTGGDRGPATAASLVPYGVALDAAGNLVVSSGRIRVVAESSGRFYGISMIQGDIYTVAGDSTSGYSGDGGRATSAELDFPEGVAVDGGGNLVIADNQNFRVRVVAAKTGMFYGIPMTKGDIYTVAGDGTLGSSGDDGPGPLAELDYPEGVALDDLGNLVIADTGNNALRVVAATTGTFYGMAMTQGDIYTVAGNGTFGYSGDGGPATSAQLQLVFAISGTAAGGLALDANDNLVIADTFDNRVRVVAARTGMFYGIAMTQGDIYTVAGDGNGGLSGDGVPATSAELTWPVGVALDANHNLVIADSADSLVRVVAYRTGTFYGIAMTRGDIYTVAGNGNRGYSGDNIPATSAELYFPYGVAVDARGNLVFSDTANERVRVVATKTGTFYGTAMTQGDIYTVAGNGTGGYSGDFGPAISAELNGPLGITIDSHGNIVIADALNSRVRVVATENGTFYGISMMKGDIYTVAGSTSSGYSGDGGPATSAELNAPQGVALTRTGDVLIADQDNNVVRTAISSRWQGGPNCELPVGDICTTAGNGTPNFSGDGAAAISAELDAPFAVVADRFGNFYIADSRSNRVREVGGYGLQFATTMLPPATVGTAYSAPVAAQGGTSPYTWRLGSGLLPPGLTLDTTTGVISGVPTTVGTFSFRIMVTDDAYPPARATTRLSIAVS